MNKTKNVAVSTMILLASVFGVAFSSFAQNSKLTDPEIASIAVTANQVDIDQAAVARQRSKNPEVIHFAQTMTNDHKAVIAQAVALVTKLKVTPQDNAVSKKLTADADQTIANLKKKSGKAFDKAYVDNEVAYHKAVIDVVQGTLIPATDNAELKALLEEWYPL